nr:alpha-N-arabinofuranosidase [Treponema sp.]
LMDGLSLHHYTVEPDWDHKHTATNFDEKGWYLALKNSGFMETLVRRHDEIMTKYDPDKRIALVVDEWGMWHAVEPGTNPGFLYQQSTIRDAIVAGIHFNIFNNHSDRVRVANIAQAVNVLQSPVLTEGTKMVKTPTWYVFHMYKPHMDATLLASRVATNQIGPDDARVDAVTASASHKDGCYTISFTNAELTGSKQMTISLAGLKGKIKEAKGTILAATTMRSCNTFDVPDNLKEENLPVQITGDKEVQMTVPAMSVVTVTLNA